MTPMPTHQDATSPGQPEAAGKSPPPEISKPTIGDHDAPNVLACVILIGLGGAAMVVGTVLPWFSFGLGPSGGAEHGSGGLFKAMSTSVLGLEASMVACFVAVLGAGAITLGLAIPKLRGSMSSVLVAALCCGAVGAILSAAEIARILIRDPAMFAFRPGLGLYLALGGALLATLGGAALFPHVRRIQASSDSDGTGCD